VQVCIICGAGFASRRRLQVSSNVRPHTKPNSMQAVPSTTTAVQSPATRISRRSSVSGVLQGTPISRSYAVGCRCSLMLRSAIQLVVSHTLPTPSNFSSTEGQFVGPLPSWSRWTLRRLHTATRVSQHGVRPAKHQQLQVKRPSLQTVSSARQAYSRRAWPNPSFKRSANSVPRWPSSAGPAAHFALAVQRGTPSSPA
jgi:hypothetical protein